MHPSDQCKRNVYQSQESTMSVSSLVTTVSPNDFKNHQLTRGIWYSSIVCILNKSDSIFMLNFPFFYWGGCLAWIQDIVIVHSSGVIVHEVIIFPNSHCCRTEGTSIAFINAILALNLLCSFCFCFIPAYDNLALNIEYPTSNTRKHTSSRIVVVIVKNFVEIDSIIRNYNK